MRAATYGALGAEPVELPAGSPLNSVDGAELSADILKDNPSVQHVRELTANVALWPKPITIVMNAKIFSSLSPRQQNALRNAGRVAFAADANAVSQGEDDARRVLCRIGVPFVHAQPSQLMALRAAVQPVYNEIERGAGNATAIRTIETMKRSARPDAPTCSSRQGSANTAGSHSAAIDGTYRTSFSKQQLARSHYLMDAGEINDENWGTFTLRLSSGFMTLTQRNAAAARRESGRYTVIGNTIRLEIDQTGEKFAFRWNLYRETLKFQRDEKLGVGPTPFLVKPWHRLHA